MLAVGTKEVKWEVQSCYKSDTMEEVGGGGGGGDTVEASLSGPPYKGNLSIKGGPFGCVLFDLRPLC